MRAREFINENKGLPFPGTYEQEYGMFNRKGSRKITAMTNEALDSSYPYEGTPHDGRYKFETEDGVKYSVQLQGTDMVEVAFSAITPGSEDSFRPYQTKLIGTGNSRKVFGTVIQIVLEYMDYHEPETLYFTAERDEPSRIKLYNALLNRVDQVLPNYQRTKDLDLGSGIAYMIKRKDSTVTEPLGQ